MVLHEFETEKPFLYNVHISPYEQGNIFLIMTHYVPENYYYTKKQINKLIGETKKIQVSH